MKGLIHTHTQGLFWLHGTDVPSASSRLKQLSKLRRVRLRIVKSNPTLDDPSLLRKQNQRKHLLRHMWLNTDLPTIMADIFESSTI